jgi:hypothetical protein
MPAKTPISFRKFKGYPMDVIDLPLGQIIPCARNPRRNEKAVATVLASIKEFGWCQRIVDNRSDENAEWDNDLLNLKLADPLEADFDLDLTGITDEELNGLLKAMARKKAKTMYRNRPRIRSADQETFGFCEITGWSGRWI